MYTFINVFLITLKHIAHYYYNGFEEDIYIYIYIYLCVYVCIYIMCTYCIVLYTLELGILVITTYIFAT